MLCVAELMTASEETEMRKRALERNAGPKSKESQMLSDSDRRRAACLLHRDDGTLPLVLQAEGLEAHYGSLHGDYTMVEGQRAVGLPIWKRATSLHWIFREYENVWRLGGLTCAEEYADRWPHEIPRGGWRDRRGTSSRLRIVNADMPQLLKVSNAGPISGTYKFVPEQVVAKLPVWRLANRGFADIFEISSWIIRDDLGRWVIDFDHSHDTGQEPLSSFDEDAYSYASTHMHGGKWPHELPKNGWMRVDPVSQEWSASDMTVSLVT